MLGEEGTQFLLVRGVESVETDERVVAPAREGSVRVEDIRDPAAHAGGEVASRRADDGDASAGHVLAPVVAHALDDGRGAGIANGEALARESAEKRPARRRP